MRMTCIENYDPFYGFNIIKRNSIVLAQIKTDGFWISLENEQGHLLGTISSTELKRFFR
jgi:hypothetical protein